MADFTPDELAAISRAKASKVAAPQVAAVGDFTPDEQAAIARKASGPAPVAQPHAEFMATVESMLAPLTKPRPQQPPTAVQSAADAYGAALPTRTKVTPPAPAAVPLPDDKSTAAEPPAAVVDDPNERVWNPAHPSKMIGAAFEAVRTAIPPSALAHIGTMSENSPELYTTTPELKQADAAWRTEQKGAADAMREERRKARMPGDATEMSAQNVAQTAKNWGTDLTNFAMSLGHIGNEAIGFSNVPKTKPGQSVMARDFDAGKELGHNLGLMPGQTADLARGLADDTGANSLQTMPFTTIAMLLDPAYSAGKVVAGPAAMAAARTAWRGKVANIISKTVDEHTAAARAVEAESVGRATLPGMESAFDTGRIATPEMGVLPQTVAKADVLPAAAVARELKPWAQYAAQASAAVKRALTDGVLQADPRATSIADDIIHAPERASAKIKNLLEIAARQLEQGKVKARDLDLKKTALSMVPKVAENEARLARNQAAVAEATAGKVGGRQDAAGAARDAVVAQSRELVRAQKQALKAQGQIGDASAEAGAIVNSGPTQKRVTQMQRAGIDAAVPGLKLADKVLPIDATTAPGMAREVANMQRGPARQAANAAEAAALDVDGAGIRPQVSAGDVYLPPERSGPGKMTATADQAGVYGQRGDLHDLLPELPAETRLAIERAAEDASEAKSKAMAPFEDAAAEYHRATTPAQEARAQARIDASYAPDDPIHSDARAVLNLPPEATIYDAGRAVAEHLIGRNVDNAPAVLAAALERMGGKGDLNAVAAWHLAEVELQAQAKRIEPVYGGMRRPTAEVTEHTVGPGGKLDKMAESAEQRGTLAAVEDALAPTIEDAGRSPQPERGPARRAEQELIEMGSRRLTPEAPQPFDTNNAVFNRATTEAAEAVRDTAYHPEHLVPGAERGKLPIRLDELTPQKFEQVADQHLKRMTVERLRQRFQEALVGDTTQLLRSQKVRDRALQVFAGRARAAGMTGADFRNAVTDFRAELANPDLANAISKSRFLDVKAADGTPLWTRQDFADLQKLIPAKQLQKIQGEVLRSIGNDMANASQAYATARNMNAELNRFRMDTKGNVIDKTIGNVAHYSRNVIQRVLQDGEVAPQMMPFSGDAVASVMRTNAEALGLEFKIAPERIVRLADDLAQFKEAGPATSLGKAMEGYMQSALHDTDTPLDLVNVHVKPSMAQSLTGHFNAQAAAQGIVEGFPGILQALAQRSKVGVVAENLRALVNNDLSNLIVQSFRRADPMMVANIPLRALQFKAFRDGHHARLTPGDLRMFRAINNTNMIQGGQVARDLGNSSLWEHFGKAFGGGVGDVANRAAAVTETGSAAVRRGAAAVRAPGRLLMGAQDMLREAYAALGDVPFRLEEAISVYKDIERKAGMLEQGESLTVPTAEGKQWVIERTAEGINLTDVSGARAGRAQPRNATSTVSLESHELARVMADAANFAQERVFFDYGKLGNYAKSLRSGPLTLLSGIFSWFFKAVDIPGVKKGIISEMFSGPPVWETTSKGIQAMQHGDQAALSFRRAALTGQAQAAFTDQRAMEDLRRSASWNPVVAGVTLMNITNPATFVMDAKANEPLLFTQPTVTGLNAIEKIASWSAFRSVMNDSQAILNMMQTPEPGVVVTPQMEQRRKLFTRYARGEQFSVTQALQLLGLGGGPMLSILNRLQSAEADGRPFSAMQAMQEFGKQMFGSTPYSLVDVGMAAAGSGAHGLDEAMDWSNYGSSTTRAGFKGGAGTDPADASSVLRWGIRQMVGIGWSSVYYGAGGLANEATDKKFMGSADIYLNNARDALNNSIGKAAKSESETALQVYNQRPTVENQKRKDDARARYILVSETIKQEVATMRAKLWQEFDAMRNGTRRVTVMPKQ